MQHEIKATIQLDKLVMCCQSSVDDNFNDVIRLYPDEAFKTSHTFGATVLTQTIDLSRRYKFSYNVSHAGNLIGKINFCLFGQPHHDDKIWFSVNNQVFYNNTLYFLPLVFSNLNLILHNITRIEIALDCYDFNCEQVLRRSLRNKDNMVKLMGRYIDRKAPEKRIRFWNYGSLDNPFKVRTTYIKNKRQIHYSKKKNEEEEENNPSNQKKDPKSTIELAAYNKSDEINDFSPHKKYILDYHKFYNSKYKNIYREEVRIESEELSRYEKKHKKPIELSDLLNKQFLFDVFKEYMGRIIVIRDSKKQIVELYPTPFLGSCEGKLPLPLPEVKKEPQPIENKEIIINKNDFQEKLIDKKDIIKNQLQRIFSINQFNKTITNENRKEIITSNQRQDKQFPKRKQQWEFWQDIEY